METDVHFWFHDVVETECYNFIAVNANPVRGGRVEKSNREKLSLYTSV